MDAEVFLESYFMATLIVAALLAIIPAKIASDKGYSFGLWWFYGWMLWIVAIIHVSLIPDLEAERRMKEASQPKPNSNSSMSAETLKKYNELKEGGLITQEEFEEKKKEVLQLYTP